MGSALVAVLGLVLLSAVLTAAQAAAFQVGASRVRTLQEEGFSGADALARVRAQASSVGSSVRLVTRTLNLTAMGLIVATGALTPAGTPVGWDILSGIALVLLLGDLLPNIVATRHPVRLALASGPALLALVRVTRLVEVPVSRLEDVLVGNGDEELTSEERELREIHEIGEEEGVLEEGETLLVERAFRLDERTAWDVMVPRVDIFAWPEERTAGEIVSELTEVPYSRVPVYRDSVDEVTGIVYVREVYERYAAGAHDIRLSQISRAPFFVPGSLSLTQLLRDFQARRIHMGIVADEFGGTDGLVTLEDVLEELVGEIVDETDLDEVEIVHLSQVEIECDAGVDLREIDEALEVVLPKAEHRSLNGLILEELGHVPGEGESFEHGGVRIDILEATETQVLRARVRRLTRPHGRDQA
jgi:magnesium and cobalt exporter, CNNM family